MLTITGIWVFRPSPTFSLESPFDPHTTHLNESVTMSIYPSSEPVRYVSPFETEGRGVLSGRDSLDGIHRLDGSYVPGQSPIEVAFNDWCNHDDHKNKYRLSHRQRGLIIYYLRNPQASTASDSDRNTKHRAKKLYYLDRHENLMRKGEVEDGVRMPDRKVVCLGSIYKIVMDLHQEKLHAGRDKLWAELHTTYYGISRPEVMWILDRCEHCLQHRGKDTRAPLMTIKSSNVMERVQGDLIDLRATPDGDFKWVLHVKVSILFL